MTQTTTPVRLGDPLLEIEQLRKDLAERDQTIEEVTASMMRVDASVDESLADLDTALQRFASRKGNKRQVQDARKKLSTVKAEIFGPIDGEDDDEDISTGL